MNRQELFHGEPHLPPAVLVSKLQVYFIMRHDVNSVGRADRGDRGVSKYISFSPIFMSLPECTHRSDTYFLIKTYDSIKNN
jgi:hypothetical protein